MQVEQIGTCTLYRGDAREIVPILPPVDTILTDPVWPNCEHVYPGIDAIQLCSDVLTVARAQRVVLHLGIHCDPRFLQCVPLQWPFLRVCYLEFAAVGYLGRILHDADIAYAFGQAPPSRTGARVIPGRCIATEKNDFIKGWKQSGRRLTDKDVQRLIHPSPRNQQHVRWLVRWWSAGVTLDPFFGLGTTGIACLTYARPCIGIEINQTYFDLACRRIEQATRQLTLFPPQDTPAPQQARLFPIAQGATS